MPSNDPVYQKAYRDRHYAANKQRYVDQAAARKLILRNEVWELKRVPCIDCGGEFNPWQMHFDHRPGEVKLGNVGRMVVDGQRKKVFEEIKKCDVCALTVMRTERIYVTLRAWSNGMTLVFHTIDEGSIPSVRFKVLVVYKAGFESLLGLSFERHYRIARTSAQERA